jgi:hypothetical protein
MIISGGCCSRYLDTAEFVEEVDNLFSSFNDEMRVAHLLITVPKKKSYWTKASMGVSSSPL